LLPRRMDIAIKAKLAKRPTPCKLVYRQLAGRRRGHAVTAVTAVRILCYLHPRASSSIKQVTGEGVLCSLCYEQHLVLSSICKV
jgi:hypothetical protein